MDDSNLDRIAEAKSAHKAWDVLRRHYQGTTKVLSVRIQALSKTLRHFKWRTVKGFIVIFSRVLTIVNQIKALGHKLSEPEIISKVLRSLAPKFYFVAVAIE